MNDELKQLLKGGLIRELEIYFTNASNELRSRKIDRNKSFDQQGIESYANEMASNELMKIFNNLKNEVEPQIKLPPKRWG